MYPEGTKTCKVCGHILWREEETTTCFDCKETWHIIAQAVLRYLPNNRLHSDAGKSADLQADSNADNLSTSQAVA